MLLRVCAPVAGVCLLAFVIGTRHWTLISDAVLMHYVGFLIRHGFSPYRDIADTNMPGTYLWIWRGRWSWVAALQADLSGLLHADPELADRGVQCLDTTLRGN